MWKVGLLILQLALTLLQTMRDRGLVSDGQKAQAADLLKKALDDLALASTVRADVDAVPAERLRDNAAGFFRD